MTTLVRSRVLVESSDLMRLQSVYPNAVCLHLETEIEKNGNSMSLKFHHRVVECVRYQR